MNGKNVVKVSWRPQKASIASRHTKTHEGETVHKPWLILTVFFLRVSGGRRIKPVEVIDKTKQFKIGDCEFQFERHRNEMKEIRRIAC